MNKKDLLYEYIKSNTTITSKKALALGYARIYLSMLENEKKIFKIGRGLYSINKNLSVNPLVEFQKNNTKIIYSGFTALNLLEFYKIIPNKVQISVPQGYNASRYENYDVFYNSLNNYGIGTTKVIVDNEEILVYDVERTICDIIKDPNRFSHEEYNRLINFYFTHDTLDYHKLLEYSKLLKVSKKVQLYLSLFKA